jgi:hypothetical protein
MVLYAASTIPKFVSMRMIACSFVREWILLAFWSVRLNCACTGDASDDEEYWFWFWIREERQSIDGSMRAIHVHVRMRMSGQGFWRANYGLHVWFDIIMHTVQVWLRGRKCVAPSHQLQAKTNYWCMFNIMVGGRKEGKRAPCSRPAPCACMTTSTFNESIWYQLSHPVNCAFLKWIDLVSS